MKRKQSLYKPAAIGMSLLMTAGLTACQGGSASSDTKADKSSAKYQVTEENEAKEMVMNNQPESSYWFPEQLLRVGLRRRPGSGLQYQYCFPLPKEWTRKTLHL